MPPHKALAAPGLDACLLPPLAMLLRLPQVLSHNLVLRVAATLGCCRYTHGNRLTGGVPAQWAANGSFTNLKELTVSGNPLGGELPVEWGLGPQAFPSLQVSDCTPLCPCRLPAELFSSFMSSVCTQQLPVYSFWSSRHLRTLFIVRSPRHLHLACWPPRCRLLTSIPRAASLPNHHTRPPCSHSTCRMQTSVARCPRNGAQMADWQT